MQILPNRDLEVTTERTRLRLNVVDWNRFPPNVANPFLIVVATLLQHSAYVSKNGPFPALMKPVLKWLQSLSPSLFEKDSEPYLDHHVIICHVRFILQTPPAYRSLTGSAASAPKWLRSLSPSLFEKERKLPGSTVPS